MPVGMPVLPVCRYYRHSNATARAAATHAQFEVLGTRSTAVSDASRPSSPTSLDGGCVCRGCSEVYTQFMPGMDVSRSVVVLMYVW